ncbi:MAG: hypothetical protein IKC11_03020 [Clostridia bacterium]|nr:hypothetical protein [Clostridia bacterium]
MSENTFGTRLTIDYTDFKTGIAEANRLIKLNEQQFKTASEGMDDWSNTSEGLKAKLQSLSKTIELQKQNVSAMEREYESIKNQYGENSREAQQFALKLEKEKTALAKSEKEQRKYSMALEDVEAESNDAQKGLLGFIKSLGKTKDATEDATEGTEGLGASFKTLVGANLVSGAISGLASSLGGLVSSLFQASEATKEYRMNMAKVEQTAKTMGESFDNAKENMVEMASVSGDIEATGEAINNLLASGIKGDNLDKISKQLTGASIKWKDTLKLEGLADGLQETLATNNAIGPFAELLERGGQNLESFNAQLQNCTTEAEKQNLVMKTLSDMGLEGIADGYYNANKNMIEAEKAQLRYNDTMAQVGSVMEPINTMLTNLKTNILSAFLPSLKELVNGFVALGSGAKGAVSTILKSFTNLGATIGKKISQIAKSIVTSFVQIVPDLISKFSQAFPILISLIGDYINLGLLTAKSLFEKVTTYIPELFNNIVSLFKNGFSALIGSLPSLFEGFFSAFGGFVEMVSTFGSELFTAIGEAVSFGITAIREKLPEVVNTITEGLKSFLPKVVEGATNMFNGLLTALKKILVSLKDNLPSIIDTIIKAIKTWIPILAENAFKLFKNIITGLVKFIPELVKNLPSIINAIVSGIFKLSGAIMDLGGDLLSWLWNGIKNGISWLFNNMDVVGKGILDGLTWSLKGIWDIGKNLLTGLWDGISSSMSWLWEKVKGFGNTVIGWFKGIFGIHSPSTVMAEQGKYLDQGLAVGIEKNKGYVLDSTEDLAKDTMTELKNGLDPEEQGKSLDDGLALGLEQGKSTVIDTAKSLATQINETLRTNVDGVDIGSKIAQGVAQGITDSKELVFQALTGLTRVEAEKGFESYMEKHNAFAEYNQDATNITASSLNIPTLSQETFERAKADGVKTMEEFEEWKKNNEVVYDNNSLSSYNPNSSFDDALNELAKEKLGVELDALTSVIEESAEHKEAVKLALEKESAENAEYQEAVKVALEKENDEIARLKAEIEDKENDIARILGLTMSTATEEVREDVRFEAEEIADTFTTTLTESLETVSLTEPLESSIDDFQSSLSDAIVSVFSKENLSSILQGDWLPFVQDCSSLLSDSLGNSISNGLTSLIGGSLGGPLGAILGNLAGGLIDNIFGGLFKKQEKSVSSASLSKATATKQKDYSFFFSDNELKGLSGIISSTSDAIKADRERVTQIINFNQTNTSPKALSTAEIYRQTNRAINLLGVKSYV